MKTTPTIGDKSLPILLMNGEWIQLKTKAEKGQPMTIEIEKDVPIPAGRAKRAGQYPFATMEIGDSFLVKTEEQDKVMRALLGVALAELGKGRITTRKVDGGVRAWRVS